MTAKLTPAQLKGLSYYKYLALPSEERKALRAARKNPSHPDPRVIQALCDKGIIEVYKYDHGPIHRLTESGEALR